MVLRRQHENSDLSQRAVIVTKEIQNTSFEPHLVGFFEVSTNDSQDSLRNVKSHRKKAGLFFKIRTYPLIHFCSMAAVRVYSSKHVPSSSVSTVITPFCSIPRNIIAFHPLLDDWASSPSPTA